MPGIRTINDNPESRRACPERSRRGRHKTAPWLASTETALLRVPSAIAPETFNLLLNPAHREAKKVVVVDYREWPWDAVPAGLGRRFSYLLSRQSPAGL
jgi:RES domain-containing protein